METLAWSKRLLSTQLASWAQLRHDTILYVKQSYSSGAVCQFPSAYVEPYPEFFAALVDYAEHGAALAEALAQGDGAAIAPKMRSYFDHLADISRKLRDMAAAQRNGTELTAEQLGFINDIVRNNEDGVCSAPPSYSGWYADLLYRTQGGKLYGAEFDPTIADVHTQPSDETGNDVGRVLHVGTGYARLMVVTVNGCSGTNAYAGLASSYYEKITDGWQRLTDETWAQQVGDAADVPWTLEYTAGAIAP
jgi:hypothetical protein